MSKPLQHFKQELMNLLIWDFPIYLSLIIFLYASLTIITTIQKISPYSYTWKEENFLKIQTTDLIPEKEVCLREFKFIYVASLHEGDAHHVEAGKNPAPPWRLLVGDWPSLVLDLGEQGGWGNHNIIWTIHFTPPQPLSTMSRNKFTEPGAKGTRTIFDSIFITPATL